MTSEKWAGLILLSITTSITPGPNNVMLLASGARFGFSRTIPHLLGISAGFCALLLAVGLGMGAALAAFPAIHAVLKILGAGYLTYIAWGIANSRESPPEDGGGGGQPMSLAAAALFQWVNPKGWIMAVTGMAMYADAAQPYQSIITVCAVFTLLNLPCVCAWAAFGMMLRGFLSNPKRLKWFNWTMAALLAASVIPLIE